MYAQAHPFFSASVCLYVRTYVCMYARMYVQIGLHDCMEARRAAPGVLRLRPVAFWSYAQGRTLQTALPETQFWLM